MRTLLLCCSALLIAYPALAQDEKHGVSTPTITASHAKPAPPEATVASARTTSGQPFSVEMHMTTGGEETVIKRTVDGPKTREDGTRKGRSSTMIMLGDKQQTMIIIDPDGTRASTWSEKSQMDRLKANAPTEAASLPTAPPQVVPKLIGRETIDGRATDKYEVDYGDQGKGTMWIDAEKNLPVRMEAEGSRIDFKNYQFVPQAADAFEIPEGYQVTDMDQMLKNMPKTASAGKAQDMVGLWMAGLGSSFAGGLGGAGGGMLGGPLGAMVGQYVGSKIGQRIGYPVGEKAPGAVAH